MGRSVLRPYMFWVRLGNLSYNPRRLFGNDGDGLMKFKVCLVVAALLILPTTRLLAQNSDKEKDGKSEKPAEKCDAAVTKEEVSTTDHTIRIGGQSIPYKATASTTLLKNEKGEPVGLMYSVAYTRSDVKDLT